jgi:hypothetical protein
MRPRETLTSVVIMRAPPAPSGWPMAITPPLTLVLARSAPTTFAQRGRLRPLKREWAVDCF